jgi:ATP-dependent phosphofructokinase / diphosphate-dependent phosphofructokinase
LTGTTRLIGVLTGGGDAPGLNAVLRAVVKTAATMNWSVVGIEDGFEGLLGNGQTRSLTVEDVRGLLPRGGSILGCSNRGHFGLRPGEGGMIKDHSAFKEALASFKRLRLDALVVIGGDGSQRIAYELFLMGMPVIGVPKTIDNDLAETDFTFGFDTALEIATEAVDRLHTTAESHGRVMLVEVMGRDAGWIALLSGIAGGADVILIPEIPFQIERVVAKISLRESIGRKFSIIVVAEGAHPIGGEVVYQSLGLSAAPRLGGIADQVALQITSVAARETRVVVLGHLQRGGSPTAFDRVLASAFGAAAVRAIADGKLGHLVVWRNNEVVTVALERAIKELKTVPPSHFLVRAARDLGISFGGAEDR